MKALVATCIMMCGVLVGVTVAAETKSGATTTKPEVKAQDKITYGKAVGIPANMLFTLDEKGGFAVPEWCEAWFDGCNNCSMTTHMGQLIGACSSRSCNPDALKQPHCTKRKPEAKK